MLTLPRWRYGEAGEMMWRLLIALLCGVATPVAADPARVPVPSGASVPATTVTLVDPSAAALIDPATQVTRLAGGFGFTEGPVWASGGYLLFSDMPGDVIWKLVPGQPPSVYRTNIAFDGPDVWRFGSVIDNGFPESDPRFERFPLIGPDGLAIDRQGRIVFCSYAGRSIIRLERDGRRRILAERFQGKRFNGTNDIVVKSDGAIYFTDTFGGLRKFTEDSGRELPTNGVYRLSRRGVLDMVVSDMPSVNGLAFSPDERFIYVNGGRDNYINRYPVLPDGSLGRGEHVLTLEGDPRTGATDGMKVDRMGNIYVTGPGGIWIVSPEGKHLATIHFPEKAVNLAFGGKDKRTLFVTARTSIYSIPVRIAGI